MFFIQFYYCPFILENLSENLFVHIFYEHANLFHWVEAWNEML